MIEIAAIFCSIKKKLIILYLNFIISRFCPERNK
jgi:hypothetical protein